MRGKDTEAISRIKNITCEGTSNRSKIDSKDLKSVVAKIRKIDDSSTVS
jgi:hypothetical protein